MIIKVAKEHIDKGMRGDCELCPVALAIKTFVKVDKISVGSLDIRILQGNNSRIITTPDSVVNFIKQFDNPFYVIHTPFEFELVGF